MTPEQSRNFNTIFGGVFTAVGVIAWILSLYFAIAPNEPIPAPVLGVKVVDIASCKTTLSMMGYAVSDNDQAINAFEQLVTDNPQAQLEKASAASLVCKLPLSAFCMGEACEQPGLTLTLSKHVGQHQPNKPNADPASGPSRASSASGSASSGM